jgi:hypothetical protein
VFVALTKGLEGPSAMTLPRPQKCYRGRYCGVFLPAWLPVAKRPNGAMLLQHLSAMHLTEVGPYLERMRTEEIATVAAEAYEVVEENETR